MLAPPSIRMRRKPQPARAARIAAGRDVPLLGRQGERLDPPGGGTGLRGRDRDDEAPDAVVGEQPGVGRQPPARIDHDPRRMRAGDAPDGEPGIVGEHGPDADHDGVDQGAQPMQVRETLGPVDVMGMAAFGGDPAVERLADLADHHQVVDRSGPQRAEQIVPRCRQGVRQDRNRFGNRSAKSGLSCRMGRSWPVRIGGCATELAADGAWHIRACSVHSQYIFKPV